MEPSEESFEPLKFELLNVVAEESIICQHPTDRV